MQLHIDSTIGDLYTYQIYDIDYSVFSALPNFTTTISPTVSEGYTIHKWYVENNTGALTNGLPASIPRKPEQNGNILPQRFVYTDEIGGINYLEKWFDSAYYEVLTSQPSDWGTNPNYLKIPDTSGSYRYVIGKIAGRSETFAENSCYKDLQKMCCRKFYTNRGGHFAVTKCGSYNRTVRNTCQWTVGTPPMNWNDTTADIQKNYMFVSDVTGNYFNSSFYISRTTDNVGAGAAYNSNFIFVHYTLSGVEYYGIAEILFNTFDDDAIPIRIMVCGIDKTFWNDNLIPGGESGAGEWGGKTIPTVNDGTFTSTSDSITPSNPDHSTTAIQTKVNNALSGLFSGLTGVYGIYMLDTASGADRVFTNLNKIFGVLYDSGNDAFLNRYLQSMYNPLSAVISMHLLPYQFAASAIFGATVTKKLTISGYPVSDKIAEKYSVTAPEYNILKPVGKVTFNEINIPRFFGGFADFAPYTQCILHLPFIGAVELKTNSIAHGSITVEYLCDIMSGNVTARICCTDSENNSQYVQTVSGNCAYNIPLFSMTQDGSPVGKMLSGAAGLVSGALTGNPVNVATGAAGIIGGAIESSISPRSTQISGNMGGNNMLMSNLDVWLEIIRPVWVENMYYQKLNGIPADMSHCIADCGQETDSNGNPIATGVAYDGYLQIEKIDLDNVPCTDIEKKEIETLLKQGVFIRGAEI